MNEADLLAAFDLPSNCRVDQRVPKKLFVENGAPTAADKRRINDGVEEIQWVAALKPNTIGVPEYRDDVREYLEIALLNVTLRPDAKAARLAELVHRAVPYPVVLVMVQSSDLKLSLAHKRWSQGEADKTVLDGDLIMVDLNEPLNVGFVRQFLQALPLARHPRSSLYALYQSWFDTLIALNTTRLTGQFATSCTPKQSAARLAALQLCRDIDSKITSLNAAASKEKQMSRQVSINLEIKELQAERELIVADLSGRDY